MTGPLIYCDLGEQRSDLPDLLAKCGCAINVCRLDSGDYLLSGTLAVERKSAGDLVKSIISKVLFEQLDRAARTYGKALLLIEGDSWQGDRVLKTPMLGQLYHHIARRDDLGIIYSPSTDYSARLLKDLARREQSGPSDLPVPRPSPRAARTPADVLRALPDVADSNAPKLLEAFGSIRAVVTATEAELQAVLGPKRGAKVYELLNREAEPHRLSLRVD